MLLQPKVAKTWKNAISMGTVQKLWSIFKKDSYRSVYMSDGYHDYYFLLFFCYCWLWLHLLTVTKTLMISASYHANIFSDFVLFFIQSKRQQGFYNLKLVSGNTFQFVIKACKWSVYVLQLAAASVGYRKHLYTWVKVFYEHTLDPCFWVGCPVNAMNGSNQPLYSITHIQFEIWQPQRLEAGYDSITMTCPH